MSYYDQTFEPWKIVDGQCVVADESEWQKLLEWDLLRSKFPKGERSIFKVPTDIFEDVEGLVVNPEGAILKETLLGTGYVSMKHHDDDPPLTINDVLTRFFQTVDSTPHVDYLIVTQHPELVREKWMCPNCKAKCSIQFSCDTCLNMAVGFGDRPNVILAVPVETQADIERLVPELLKCHDLCKGLEVICNPREELDVSRFIPSPDGFVCPNLEDGAIHVDDGGAQLNRIIVEGNEHPIHPQWLRSLRDQCKDVVPFHLSRWKSTELGDVKAEYTGSDPLWKPVRNHIVSRLLDGQEHNGRIQ